MERIDQLAELYEQYKADPRFSRGLNREGINFVPGAGPLNPNIMLIGEMAGLQENSQRMPFVGRAGSNLAEIMDALSVDLYDVFRTNAIKFWPENENAPGETRNATKEETQAAREYLAREIAIVNPKVVGLCGHFAMQMKFPEYDKIFTHNGKLIDGKYVVLYHPAVYSYSPHKRPILWEGYTNLVGYSKREAVA